MLVASGLAGLVWDWLGAAFCLLALLALAWRGRTPARAA
jgi:hypothetical protein